MNERQHAHNTREECVEEVGIRTGETPVPPLIDSADSSFASLSSNKNDKYLTFEVSGQVYGIATRRIREVVPYGVISRVPDVPEFLLGVTNLRHEVIAIVDLQLYFGAAEITEKDINTCFIIVLLNDSDGVEHPVGLVARRIYSARKISAEDIDGPPTVGGWEQVQYIAGLGKDNDSVTILLDVDRLLGPEGGAIREVNDMKCALVE